VKALIGICAEGDIQKEFDGLVRSKEMYKNLASDLQEEQGYDRDWKKYESKIKTEYRTEKENNNKTGRGRKTSMYYNDLDRDLVIAQQRGCQLYWMHQLEGCQ
jgi:hypothetical protein